LVSIPNINSIYAEKHIKFNYANAVDMFPRTDSSKDIHSVLSNHV